MRAFLPWARALTPLDLHAHIDSMIERRALESLGDILFAAARSTDEFQHSHGPIDVVTVGGRGVSR